MVETVLRIGFSLLVVLGLMWAMARVARRPLGRRTGSALAVVARQQLSRNSVVAVVRVADRALILGVTDTQVTMLGEADLTEVEKHQAVPAGRPRAHRDGPGDQTGPSGHEPEYGPGHDPIQAEGTGWPGLPAETPPPWEPDQPRPGPGERRQSVVLDQAGHPVHTDEPGGPLDGSILSPRTWRRTIDFLRDRTARR